MAASIFNGTAVKILKNILRFKDGTELSSSTVTYLNSIILESSFSLANNQSSPTNVTGLLVSSANRSVLLQYSISIDATSDLFESGTIAIIKLGSDWVLSRDFTGDNSLVSFDITSGGQVTYTTSNYSGFVSGTLKYRYISSTQV